MKVRLTKGEARKEAPTPSGQVQKNKQRRPVQGHAADAELRRRPSEAQKKRSPAASGQPARKKQPFDESGRTIKNGNGEVQKRRPQQSSQQRPPVSSSKQPPTKKRNLKIKRKAPLIILGIALVFLLMLLGGYAFYNAMLQPVGKSTESTIVEIPEGSTLKDVSQILYDEGLIKNSMVFESYAGRRSRGASGIQAADYELSQSMSVPDIFTKLINGDAYHGEIKTIVFPEGRNISEMAPIIGESKVCTAEEFIAETKDLAKYKAKYAILSSIPSGKDRTLEGYLFPDTYHLPEGCGAEDVVTAMLDRFVEVYDAAYLKETKSLGKTVDEIVIMGSIIELETKLPEDKANAASVFYNRIANSMPLQSDITVDYARGEKTPVLTEEQTQFDSPYNTYINLGLPVGPICSPGKTSLEAALRPAATDYLFFVADMESGKLHFNTTLEGHDQDVLTYMGN
ncbi:MAG: endolytic transglycosylase MltG [Eubacterium sp.]